MVEIRRCNSEKIAERQSVCVCVREREVSIKQREESLNLVEYVKNM